MRSTNQRRLGTNHLTPSVEGYNGDVIRKKLLYAADITCFFRFYLISFISVAALNALVQQLPRCLSNHSSTPSPPHHHLLTITSSPSPPHHHHLLTITSSPSPPPHHHLLTITSPHHHITSPSHHLLTIITLVTCSGEDHRY